MHIVIPTADYPPIEGGIGTLSLHVSRELAKMGHRVTVIAPYFPNMEHGDAHETATIIRFRGYHLGWFRFFPMAAKSVQHIRDADMVLGINIAYGAIMAWMMRRPYVTFAYAYEFLKFGKGPLAGLLKRVYKASVKTVSISHFTRDELERFGVPASSIEVILPGASPALRVSKSSETALRERLNLANGPVLLAVGRLIPRKGHATVIDSMPAILERHPNAKLVCVGRGPSMESLIERAQQCTVHESVRFPGYLDDDDLATLYHLSSVFVLPTRSEAGGQVEGFGLVFAEANAYGLPVIAGRSGGTCDAILHEKTGLLIEPDSVEACSHAVISLLDDPKRATKMGNAGRKRVDSELNWNTFTRKMMEIIEAQS